MLLGTLGANLLGHLLSGKRIARAGYGHPSKQGKRIVTASWLWSSLAKRLGFLILSHPLTNFKIQKYYENEPRFIGGFSRDNLPKK